MAVLGILSRVASTSDSATFAAGPRVGDGIVQLRAARPGHAGLGSICFGSIIVTRVVSQSAVDHDLFTVSYECAATIKPWAREYLERIGVHLDGRGIGTVMVTGSSTFEAVTTAGPPEEMLRKIYWPGSGQRWHNGVLPCDLTPSNCEPGKI